jgi:hypothetical protein
LIVGIKPLGQANGNRLQDFLSLMKIRKQRKNIRRHHVLRFRPKPGEPFGILFVHFRRISLLSQ